jgi:hypothetical protein
MCSHHEFVICDMFYIQPYGEMIGSMKRDISLLSHCELSNLFHVCLFLDTSGLEIILRRRIVT